MDFELRLRGKRVTINALSGVEAFKAREGRAATRSAGTVSRGSHALSACAQREAPEAAPSLIEEEGRIFESAGWRFVQARGETAMAFAARGGVEELEAARRVYVGQTGLMIGTRRLTVQFLDEVPAKRVEGCLATDELWLVRQLSFARNTFEVRIASDRPELEVVQEFQEKTSKYSFVEPVFLEAISNRLTPNDPDFRRQWQHRNDGSDGGLAGADIASEKAWDLTRGEGVRLAVLDSGFQVTHPDLAPGIVGGGFFVSNASGGSTFKSWKPGTPGFPLGDHGTFCLGMAGARMNNSHGGCGIAPGADLLAIACLADQVGTQLTLARAIAYAADPTTEDANASSQDGAHVIVCSLGPNGGAWEMSSVLELAISSAATQGRAGLGIPIFWAVTNGPYDVAGDDVCSHDDVIAVSRSNRHDLEDGAGHGEKLEFLAPGVEVYSTRPGSEYGYKTGCSFAAPLASGVAALVLARYPTWTSAQVRQRLRDSCDKVGGVTYGPTGRHEKYGYGRINAHRAVQ